MVKRVLNILSAIKLLKKLDLDVYFFQNLVYMEESLMKLYISFLIKEDELLEKYNEVWEKEFDGEPVYNEK